jgi:hypothetical protein
MGYGAGVMPPSFSEKVLANQEAADCLIPMGITSENVAEQYNISRKVQDEFAANSYAKAATAQKAGKFREEIVPVKVGRFVTCLTFRELYLHGPSFLDQVCGSQDGRGEGSCCRPRRWNSTRCHRRILVKDQARL